MKQIFVTLAFALSMIFSSPAQNNTPQALPATQPGSVTVVSDTADAYHEAQIDSIVRVKVDKLINKEMKRWKQRYAKEEMKDLSENILENGTTASIVIFLIVFAFPLLVVGMILYYRYKTKKSRYEVMKETLAHGSKLPSEFSANEAMLLSGSSVNESLWRKGVKNFFLGLGLALFLGIMTTIQLSSIGILIMCIGGGEIILGCFPSAPQFKSFRRKYGKEEKPCPGQPDDSCRNENPLPETRQTEQAHPSGNTPRQDTAATEEADKKNDTEESLPEAKENPYSGENESSRTDKEETKG